MAIAELWERLQEDPPGTHTFYLGISDDALANAEKSLKLKLPRSYRRFLRCSNGAVLFGEERILGVGPDCPEGLELVAMTTALRAASPGLPEHLLPFAPTAEGGIDCFLLRGGLQDHEYAVVFWSPTGGESEVSHDSFDEWLFELTEMLRPDPDHRPAP